MLLISSGLVGQDIRRLDKISVLGLVWWRSLALMAYEVQVSFVEYLGAFLPVSDDIGRAEKQP